MKFIRIAFWVVLTAAAGAQAQVTNIWQMVHPAQFSATYFDNIDLTGPMVTAFHRSIDFDWNAFPYNGSPDPSISPTTFSARWTGKMTPFYSENYTIHAVGDDGIRVWINDQPVIDAWFDQEATEHSSVPIALTAGVEIAIRVEYYQNTGSSVARLLWSSASQPKVPVHQVGTPVPTPFGGNDGVGGVENIAVLGSSRFVIASSVADEPNLRTPGLFFGVAGFAWLYDSIGNTAGFAKAPGPRMDYGKTVTSFPDGRFLVSAVMLITNSGSFPLEGPGRVFLHDSSGNLLRWWDNPEGTTNGTVFGNTLAVLPGNRFAASSSNKVYVFDAGSVAPPLATLSNPSPSTLAMFFFEGGRNLAAVGPDRIVVGVRTLDATAYKVLVFNTNGTHLITISSPNSRSDGFGNVLRAVDNNRFLVGAPSAAVTHFDGSQFITNGLAGAVYLFDDTGAFIHSFTSPEVLKSRGFGSAISLLGPSRVLIGSPYDVYETNEFGTQTTVGRVFVYNMDGAFLSRIDKPGPPPFSGASFYFGSSIEALDGRRFLVTFPQERSVYGYDIPIPELEIGSEIPRPNGVDASGLFVTQGPTVVPAGAAFWHIPSGKLFAVRPGGIRVTWPLLGGLVNNWEASLIWPTNVTRYQVHIAGQAAVDLSNGGTFPNATLLATTTDANADVVSQNRQFSASLEGTTLLLLSSGNPSSNAIRFQLVRSIHWSDPAFLHDNAPAVIGAPIVDPGNYFEPAAGSPQVILPAAVYCPAPVFDPATRTGTIIPVNRDNPANPADDLVVAYYRRGTNLYDPVTGLAVANNVYWPAKPVRFAPQWPTSAPHLVIAGQQGTGAIDPGQHVDWQLYFQNNPAQAGFNPNDEHALRRPFAGSEAIFALRDDLGTPTTSEPFVLIRFRDPSNGLQWRMKVWQVVAEEAPHFFRYTAQAGLLLQPPFPLSTLAVAPQTVGVSGPYWRDRKLNFWARAAGNGGGAADIVMRYFYPMQPGFFFPGLNPPALGENVPLLDVRAGTPGEPINITFNTVWPASVPELRVGETLVKPKNGLPQIAGQSSVEILYQQSFATGTLNSVQLIDPVRIRSVPLAQLPPGIETRVRTGNLYFPALPPHLEGRVSYDPVAHRLRLQGQFVEPPAGESYLLLNVLTPRDKAALLALSTDTAFQAAVESLAVQAASVLEVSANSTGFDSLALTAGNAPGIGYVALAFGNNTNLSAPAEPISVSIIKVTCPLYRGELKVIESPNPLAEQLTLRHSGDFAGRPDDFEFEWRSLPPEDGLPSPLPPQQWAPFTPFPATGVGAVDITLSGPGLYTLSDNYFVCRYRRVSGPMPCGADWSAWTGPMLAEGWIKRVLAGIGPFEQRIQDYQDTQVNTIVSMISQAGARAVGDIALNLHAVNQAGLIEVYETVLRRGMGLSIEGNPSVDYPPANDALLLAVGRLADLYMLLGNEAYADAADPTIAFGTDNGIYGAQATSLHCFMNQTASLMEEELALLRGRDNSKLPSVQTHPVYNRLIWNFTRDITGGEVAYALNYNLRNVNGDVAGAINEADARLLYPQGHGDAYGHYLAAIKNYYRLLRNPSFTWVPRIEAVIVGGVPVSVDFLDERKFAATAAARARTGVEIVNLTFRSSYVENPAKPWQSPADTDTNRAWSMHDWATRAGQGALFDWVVANAMLPDVDTNPSHTGIQKIERGNIRELPEIAEAYRQIQEQVDQADTGRNPLGLANNVVPFDIDPGAIAAGKTHFDQINERANEALKNAVAVFDHANASTQLLRRQADEANSFQLRVTDTEADYNNRLIEIFGTPYSDDIGPTGTYPTGYAGPDIYHYDYVENPEIAAAVTGQQPTLRFQLSDLDVLPSGALNRSIRNVTFSFSPNGFGLEKPAAWIGQRSAPGEIQLARSALTEAVRRLERGVTEYENLVAQIDDTARSLQAEANLNANQINIRRSQLAQITQLDTEIESFRSHAFLLRSTAESGKIVTDFIVDAMPDVVGLASDVFAFKGALIRAGGRLAQLSAVKIAEQDELFAAARQDEKNRVAALTDLQLFTSQAGFNQQERLRQLEQLVRTEPTARLELSALRESLNQALGRYQAALARGLRLLEDRTRFRQQTAAQIQSYRYKDMAFRLFRSDALQKYRAQFDLAARYAYLAAKAYDYETCLAPGDNRGPGSAFMTGIIRSRSLGLFSNGSPLPGSGVGDPGLTDPLARMTANWNLVLKGQLGFNNPQTETGRFSLRNELFRIVTGSTGSKRWRETLERHVVPDLLSMPEFQRHCIPFSPTQPVEPAIVIPFATTINFGLNFFGWPAGGGDNDYDSTKFATKVRSVGVWFANYNNLGGGMINTPRVYLVPVGLDVMRAPTQGQPYVREWRILDQALPVPFPLNAGALSDPSWIPINDTLSEDFAAIRRFGRFRAFHDSGNFNPAETVTDTRLIGRSVWNTRWLLIIPAGTLHTDRNEGIQRFINGALLPTGARDGNGVSDIKVFFQTYAYSGN